MDRINRNANIPNIEDFLYTEMYKILDNITIGFFPKVLKDGTDDSITMIDVANDINYDDVSIPIDVYIWLCAKNHGSSKNSSLLKTMENKLDDMIEKFQDKNNIYLLKKKRAKAMYIDDADYSCNMVTIKVTVL